MSESRRDAEFQMVIGVLLVALCGSCTLYFQTSGEHLDYGLSLVIGGVPTAIGAFLFVSGLRRWRKHD